MLPTLSQENLSLKNMSWLGSSVWGELWEDDAWQEYIGWQEQDKKTLRKINRLVKDIQRNPFDGMGHPEPLSGNLSGWWADILTRRIV